MSKNSRARALAKAATSAKASAARRASLPQEENLLAYWGTLLAGGIIVLAALAAYHNSFRGPFILDDHGAITENPSIRQLGTALSPPPAATTVGRPLLNLTFALNYALGGMDVQGYHAANLLIHALAGLTLFGIVRRTLLERPTFNFQHPTSKSTNSISQGLSPTEALPLALAVAVIWVVHPLQTEAVTYVSQRAESLMGLFYLLTLYCFVRGVEGTGRRPETRRPMPEDRSNKPEAGGQRSKDEVQNQGGIWNLAAASWLLASFFSCLLGAMTKEIIATVPVMVLLYDRTFVAGSFHEAWRRRWPYYVGLAGTWLLLASVLAGSHQRGVGLDLGVTWWSYILTSCCSVILYLKLAIWPHPLVFDYGLAVTHSTTMVLWCALTLAILVAGTVIALWRRPAIGFLGAWFFAILAPTSSFIPIAGQPMAESRMYLPLAAVIGLAAFGLYKWIGQRSIILFVIVAVGLGWLGIRRNEDYRSALDIWSDTVAKQPGNARAHNSLGMELLYIPGRRSDAISQFELALHIKPDFAEAHNNLGMELAGIPGRLPEAISHLETALQIKPEFAAAHNNLGVALANTGRLPEAIDHFEAALRISPDYTDANDNLAVALAKIHRPLPQTLSEHKN